MRAGNRCFCWTTVVTQGVTLILDIRKTISTNQLEILRWRELAMDFMLLWLLGALAIN